MPIARACELRDSLAQYRAPHLQRSTINVQKSVCQNLIMGQSYEPRRIFCHRFLKVISQVTRSPYSRDHGAENIRYFGRREFIGRRSSRSRRSGRRPARTTGPTRRRAFPGIVASASAARCKRSVRLRAVLLWLLTTAWRDILHGGTRERLL